jgi:hypothetical protein
MGPEPISRIAMRAEVGQTAADIDVRADVDVTNGT